MPEGISYYVGINAERLGGGICVAKSRKGMIFADYPDVVNVEQMCSMLGGSGKRQHMTFCGTGTSDISN